MATGTTANWKRPIPQESDVPDAAADMAALGNALDSTPLYPTTATVSSGLMAGLSYTCNPSLTMTLAASPTKGDMVRVIAGPSVTGTTPVTVTASGGKAINGVALIAASSFTLGIPFAHTTLQYDGTAWQVVETSWPRVATAMRAYYSNAGGFNPPATNTWELFPLDTASLDPGGNFSSANHYTAPVPGDYRVTCALILDDGSVSAVTLGIYKNGSQYSTFQGQQWSGGLYWSLAHDDIVPCAVGDHIQFKYNVQLGTATIGGGSTECWMAVNLVS